MKQDVIAPTVGESITEVRILRWVKPDGSAVKAGEVLIEIESDKATVEVAAQSTGALKILRPEGETVKIGEVLGYVDDAVKGTAAASGGGAGATAAAPAIPVRAQTGAVGATAASDTMGPAARKLASEMGVDTSKISGTGKDGRITKGDLMDSASSGGGLTTTTSTPVATSIATPAPSAAPTQAPVSTYRDGPGDRRVPMTRIRARIAERLVQAQRTAAILTTFNEVDLGEVQKVRAKYKDAFKAKHGVGLGFMSFFTRASVLALKEVPAVNAMIDGGDIVYRDYCDISVAIGTDRGLVVPVLRGAENMTFADIEKGILALAEKAKAGKLSIPEMSGGTFTISNGGTYGSLLSTPILNPPQSGILGMHKIQDRPMAIDGKVVVRPMMYLALSYDHRLIDGKEAVTFLVKLREVLENPDKLKLDFV